MKKLVALVLVLGLASVAQAGTVRYLQDAQYDAQATYGLEGTSEGTINMVDQADGATITIQHALTSPTTWNLYLPAADGTDGQAISTNGSGQLEWITVSTAALTTEEVQDIVGGMVTGNTETDITVTYQSGDGTLDFEIDSTITRDTEWDTPAEVETIWGYNVIVSTEIDSEAELEALLGAVNVILSTEIDSESELETLLGAINVIVSTEIDSETEFEAILGESIWTSGETIDPLDVNMTGDLRLDRTKKLILDDDQGANTYIVQNVDDTVSFFKDGTEYMRFE